MVKKLRRKFVITAMSALLVILIVLIGVINIFNVVQITQHADEMLQILTDNNGSFPRFDKNKMSPPDPAQNTQNQSFMNYSFIGYNRTMEAPYETRYFWVRLDKNASATEINTGHIAAISSSDAVSYAQSVVSSGHTSGFYSTYRYMCTQKDDGTTFVIFTDCSSGFYNAYSLLLNSLLLGLVCLAAMFILVYLLSGKAVAPVVESLEKQKRFITDAGHELKTPLAVISANIDVLELESGPNEWTQSVRNQIKRMTGLVKNMLTLSRMEEETIHLVFSDLNLSDTVHEAADSFAAVAESADKKYTVQIDPDIHCTGDKNSIHQLASLLIDNAIKYSSDQGSIQVHLSQDKNLITFEVSNTCDCIPDGNLDRLFDRFYRADSSRSRQTGGYGIGLSVARAIATSHGGSIIAQRDGDHIIRFIVTLPVKTKKKSV
ncbi:MAG: HAMP domain-containing histidine kinase [Butyrivibrio sp.]|jgi:hypothetical protein|nr:HAMP domain-containing histidine kinase [Butyrivibrio sp.]